MNLPKSFTKDHTKMTVGITLSESPKVGLFTRVKIWDVRMTQPYLAKTLTSKQMHTLEHILAFELRNQNFKGFVGVYPMGCKTGFYVVTKSSVSLKRIKAEIFDVLYRVNNNEKYVIPATDTPEKCGNFLYHERDLKDMFSRIMEFMQSL